jgi:transposase-like protein
MKKRILTDEQIETLLKNSNVSTCSPKSITYSKEFKVRAVTMSQNEGYTYKDIFKRLGFDLDVIGVKTPKECLKRWNRVYREKGIEGFDKELRGTQSTGRVKTIGVSSEDRIKRLELEVLYLKAENDFLAKLRAKRAE